MAKIEPQSSNDHQACLWGKLFKFLRFYEFQSNQANEWIKKEGGKIQKSQQQSFEKSKKSMEGSDSGRLKKRSFVCWGSFCLSEI